jgi:hypothetical protein
MQSKYHRLIATVMPENPLPGDAQLVAAMQPRARLWIIADSGKQARRWRAGRLGTRCSGDVMRRGRDQQQGTGAGRRSGVFFKAGANPPKLPRSCAEALVP